VRSGPTVDSEKNDDVVDAAERGDELRAIAGGEDRTSFPLQLLHRRIVVECHDEHVAFASGGFEIADVADMKDVEAAVGECNRPPGGTFIAHTLGELFARHDLVSMYDLVPLCGLVTLHASPRCATQMR
jgi:hypothetical protein